MAEACSGDREECADGVRWPIETPEEFALVLAHEIRNPLAVAMGWLELAREENDGEELAAVARAHDRMNALIEDILALADDGRLTVDVEPVDVAEVIETGEKNVARGKATVVTEVERTIRADPRRLQQLVENLVRNAVDHGGHGVTITIGGLDDGFYLADDGPGIPSEARERVFDAGYSTSEEGTGVGLSIARGIVEAHGWELDVTDSEDGGARFEITGVEFVSSTE